MTDRDLLALPLEQAKRFKWEQGRAHFGEDWVGGRPMVEGFGELVDLLNYIDEDLAQGFINAEQHDALEIEVARLAEAVRTICRIPRGAT